MIDATRFPILAEIESPADLRALPESRLEQAEQQQRLLAALDQLSGPQRELIVARIWGELSWEEIAELTGIPRSTANRNYQRALAQFKELLEPSCQPSTNPE